MLTDATEGLWCSCMLCVLAGGCRAAGGTMLGLAAWEGGALVAAELACGVSGREWLPAERLYVVQGSLGTPSEEVRL